MRKVIQIGFMLLLTGCYLGDDLPPDQSVWEYTLPGEVGLNQETLAILNSQIESGQYDQVDGFIVIKNGFMVFENYYGFSSRTRIKPIGNCTNGIIILMLNHFISEGMIQSIDDPIATYLPEYEDVFENDPRKRNITIRHLITHKSGLTWNESLINTQRSDSDFQQMRLTSDWARYILSKPMEADPGLRSVLNTAVGIILSKIYQNLLKATDLETYLNEELFLPLEIRQLLWERDPLGTLNGANGLYISTLDLTKIGYLMLQEGRWVDKRRILDRDWILDVSSAQEQVSNSYSYGFGWFIFTENFTRNYLPGNDKVYFQSGEAGQNLYILPESNMVVCIMAENYYYSSLFNPSLNIFLRALESIEPTSNN